MRRILLLVALAVASAGCWTEVRRDGYLWACDVWRGQTYCYNTGWRAPDPTPRRIGN